MNAPCVLFHNTSWSHIDLIKYCIPLKPRCISNEAQSHEGALRLCFSRHLVASVAGRENVESSLVGMNNEKNES